MSGEITNAGHIDVTGTTTLSSDAVFDTSGATVTVTGGGHLTLDDSKIYSGTVSDNGTVEITGVDLLSSGANLNIGAGNQLTIDSGRHADSRQCDHHRRDDRRWHQPLGRHHRY